MKSKVITIVKEDEKLYIDTRITTVLDTIDVLAESFIKTCRDSALMDSEIAYVFNAILTKKVQ